MIISIFASIWCQNLWDELILKNEIKLLEKKYNNKKIKFKVFTYDINNIFYKADSIEYIEYFPIWIKNAKNIFKNIKNFINFLLIVLKSDLIVIWWWGIFFDKEVWWVSNPLKLWYFRSIFFRLLNKKVLYYSIWIDISCDKSLNLLMKIFKWNIEIKVRDENSFNILKKISVSSEVVLDPVFYDNKFENNISDIIWKINIKGNIIEQIKNIKDLNIEWKKVWLAFRSWFIQNERVIIWEVIEYLLNKWAKVVLIPHSFHLDNQESNDYNFLSYFSDKYWISIKKTMLESYNIYKNNNIDYCFSMRLHSIILSTVYGIKIISFSYSKKTEILIKDK